MSGRPRRNRAPSPVQIGLLPGRRPNRYRAPCVYCAGPVAPGAGVIWRPEGERRYSAAHTACDADGEASVTVTTLHGEDGPVTLTQNSRGRCEDAPCCGCCTW